MDRCLGLCWASGRLSPCDFHTRCDLNKEACPMPQGWWGPASLSGSSLLRPCPCIALAAPPRCQPTPGWYHHPQASNASSAFSLLSCQALSQRGPPTTLPPSPHSGSESAWPDLEGSPKSTGHCPQPPGLGPVCRALAVCSRETEAQMGYGTRAVSLSSIEGPRTRAPVTQPHPGSFHRGLFSQGGCKLGLGMRGGVRSSQRAERKGLEPPPPPSAVERGCSISPAP